jgi:hypothetical protein
MENLLNKVKKKSLIIYNFEKKIDDKFIIIGTITVNNDTNNINVALIKRNDEIDFCEPISDHPWFLNNIYLIKEKQNKKKALNGLFIKKDDSH